MNYFPCENGKRERKKMWKLYDLEREVFKGAAAIKIVDLIVPTTSVLTVTTATAQLGHRI
jgi:hypothetical protein